jgi:hypothetical protein
LPGAVIVARFALPIFEFNWRIIANALIEN